MAQVNVAIARALSRKRLAQQVQSVAYKKKPFVMVLGKLFF